MSGEKLSRREFCSNMAALAALGAVAPGTNSSQAATPSLAPMRALAAEGKFTPWSAGCLDIHHISTGRGSAMLAICPDGTILMVDAGAIYDPLKYTIGPKPDGTRRPGEWISRYVQRHIRATGATGIDYLLVSHLHADHIGQWSPDLPLSTRGGYSLTGIMDVAEQLTIHKLVDRGYPDYAYPTANSFAAYARDKITFDNYRKYVAYRDAQKEAVERFVSGSANQFVLVRSPEKYPQFNVRNLASNGEVWTCRGDETVQKFPPVGQFPVQRHPTENMCSTAIRIQHGHFSYYTGGVLPHHAVGWFDPPPWQDIATLVAVAAGPVSVAVANHHGYVDSMGAECVRALRPRVFVIQGWDSAHPTIRPLYNMLSRDLYDAPRDVFATAVKEENIIATRDLAKLTSLQGHVVVRVPPSGDSFTVEILDNSDESDHVLGRHGPYAC